MVHRMGIESSVELVYNQLKGVESPVDYNGRMIRRMGVDSSVECDHSNILTVFY